MLNCVSNLAWKKSEEKKAFKILKKNKIKYLEFAPNLLFTNSFDDRAIKNVKKKCFRHGLKPFSMQSVLYNVKDAYIFGSKSQNEIFLSELKQKVRLANKLGAKVIVFGSPKNKKRFNKRKLLLDKIFVNTFKKISTFCKKKKYYYLYRTKPKNL